jgi:hypothetical protein
MVFKLGKRKTVHPVHYILVLFGTFAVLMVDLKIPMLVNGLRVTPFVLVTLIAAMFGDFGAGILAIGLSVATVGYILPPAGLTMDSNTLFKMLEFTVISTTIFVIAWRGRKLQASNVALREMTKTLHHIALSLKTEAQGNEQQLEKLNTVNKELVALVTKFIEDDEYWARKITTPLTSHKKKMASEQIERVEHSPL